MKNYIEKLFNKLWKNSNVDLKYASGYQDGVKDLYFEMTATRPWLDDEEKKRTDEIEYNRLESEKEKIKQKECKHLRVRTYSNPTISDVCSDCGKTWG